MMLSHVLRLLRPLLRVPLLHPLLCRALLLVHRQRHSLHRQQPLRRTILWTTCPCTAT